MRAWDGERMRYGFYVRSSEPDIAIIDIGSVYSKLRSQPDWIVMKPVDLQDKNGKEIFEGDIFIVPIAKSGVKPIMVTRVVSSFEGVFGTVHEHEGHTHKTPLRSYAFFDEIEVIGNDYESPNLLEKK